MPDDDERAVIKEWAWDWLSEAMRKAPGRNDPESLVYSNWEAAVRHLAAKLADSFPEDEPGHWTEDFVSACGVDVDE